VYICLDTTRSYYTYWTFESRFGIFHGFLKLYHFKCNYNVSQTVLSVEMKSTIEDV